MSTSVHRTENIKFQDIDAKPWDLNKGLHIKTNIIQHFKSMFKRKVRVAEKMKKTHDSGDSSIEGDGEGPLGLSHNTCPTQQHSHDRGAGTTHHCVLCYESQLRPLPTDATQWPDVEPDETRDENQASKSHQLQSSYKHLDIFIPAFHYCNKPVLYFEESIMCSIFLDIV